MRGSVFRASSAREYCICFLYMRVYGIRPEHTSAWMSVAVGQAQAECNGHEPIPHAALRDSH